MGIVALMASLDLVVGLQGLELCAPDSLRIT